MIIPSLLRYGFQLPDLNLEAFTPEFLAYTIGGFVRILAVIIGIVVFANLVAAYEGKSAQRSRRTFNSLMIIMCITVVTMLIVGPVIFKLSDPTNASVSRFTQTMDLLLPPLALDRYSNRRSGVNVRIGCQCPRIAEFGFGSHETTLSPTYNR